MQARLSVTTVPSGATSTGRRRIGLMAAKSSASWRPRAIATWRNANGAPASFSRISRMVAPEFQSP